MSIIETLIVPPGGLAPLAMRSLHNDDKVYIVPALKVLIKTGRGSPG